MKLLAKTFLIFLIAIIPAISTAEEYKFKRPVTQKLPKALSMGAPLVTDPGDRINSEEPFDIHWTKVEGATGYDTQIAIDSSFTKRLIASGTIGRNSTAASFFKDVDEVTTYYFRVRAKNNAGPGPWSNIVDIIVLAES